MIVLFVRSSSNGILSRDELVVGLPCINFSRGQVIKSTLVRVDDKGKALLSFCRFGSLAHVLISCTTF
jgi:hypothetical protein